MKPNATKHGKVDHLAMANIGRRCTMEVAEECNPEQNRPPIPILLSAAAVDTENNDDFGLEVERRSTPGNYTARRTPLRAPIVLSLALKFGDIQTDSDLHAADSQVNSKYVQINVGTLTDGLSPNIHRSMAIASIIRFACFHLLRIIRFSIAWYDTNKTRRAEASFGPAGDDNGRRYEPPPQDRIGLATAVVPSRRRPPAAPGKPSFPYFKVYYLPRRCVLAEPSQRTSDIESPRLDGVRKIRRQGLKPPESGDLSPPTRVDEDGFLRCRLAVGTILAVEVGIVRTVVAQLGKETPREKCPYGAKKTY
ncbi:hypothetical protein THAOC_32851 [Thalassiosira oceanica]|uniref:Uncharacterized protein n=1 Tax=Thalassiosira oceanica TaxID=159749 RepID=K0RNN1_THAOC|nr:hypothetical protein THAOC_32851 [Thalassiosira oceanica]|eukprot:EJK48362.1 hypothetical protein THAOC_32851 [Thalassiosira oceanica]